MRDARTRTASVAIINVDGTRMGVIRETLQAEAVLPSQPASFDEGISTIQRTSPDIILVGLSVGVEVAESFIQEAKRDAPNAVWVAIGMRKDAPTILKAMRAGFSEYLLLPEDSALLRDAVRSSAARRTIDGEKGLIVAVLGAKGGVGATTLASHLAAELSPIHRVLCIDADFRKGDMAAHVDLSPRDSIVDILPRADRLDERMLTGAVDVHANRVHYLCQPDELSFDVPDSDDVYSVIATAARSYQYVLIDVGSAVDDIALASLGVADQVLLVSPPNVVGMRDAYRTRRALEAAEIEARRIHLVLNRVPENPALSNAEIMEHLNMQVMSQVAEDTAAFSAAMAEGRLVREVNPKSQAAADIGQLVGLLTDDPDEITPVVEGASTPGFLGRLFARG